MGKNSPAPRKLFRVTGKTSPVPRKLFPVARNFFPARQHPFRDGRIDSEARGNELATRPLLISLMLHRRGGLYFLTPMKNPYLDLTEAHRHLVSRAEGILPFDPPERSGS